MRATYTLDIELVEANTTTNIASIEKGNGVYSVEWDNEEKVVNVVLARYTDCADGYPKGDEWDQDMQNGYEAEMTITPADEGQDGQHQSECQQRCHLHHYFPVRRQQLHLQGGCHLPGTP